MNTKGILFENVDEIIKEQTQKIMKFNQFQVDASRIHNLIRILARNTDVTSG